MKLTEKQLEDLAKRNLANFGPSKDMFIHGYGQVLKDGKPTVVEIKWAEDLDKVKTKLDVKNWLKDSLNTLWCIPIQLVIGNYAAFAQGFTQLYYDFKNNQYTVRK